MTHADEPLISGEEELLEWLGRWRPSGPPPALAARVLASAERAGAASQAVRVGLRCGYCHGALPREAGLFCAACLAPHHGECWDAHGGCTAAGCGGRSAVRPEARAGAPVFAADMQPGCELRPAPRRWRIGLAAVLTGSLGVAAWSGWLSPSARPVDATPAGESAPHESPALNEARACRARGDLAGALSRLDGVLRTDRAHPAAWVLRGECLLEQGHAREALEAFQQATRAAPRQAAAWRGSAAARAALGYAAEALTDLTRALELDPRAVDAHLLRARLEEQQQRPTQALAAVDRVLELAPDHTEAALQRAWLCSQLGSAGPRLTQALADLTRVLTRQPERAEALRLRALLRAQRGDLVGAEQDLGRACVLDASGTEAWSARLAPDVRSACLHGQVLLALGRPAEALPAFERALELSEGEDRAAWIGRGRAQAALGNTSAALDDLTEAIDLRPSEADGYYQRAELYAALGQDAQARRDYEQALSRDAGMGQAQLALARLLQRGADDGAEAAFAQLLEGAGRGAHPELAAQAHLGLAELLRQRAEPILCALEAGPDGPEPLVERRRAEAHHHYDRALALSPDLTAALLGRARLALAEGDRDGARVDLEALLARPLAGQAEQAARAQALLGVALLAGRGAELERAEDALRRARVLDPGLSLALVGLAHVALERAQTDLARSSFEAARVLPPAARDLVRRLSSGRLRTRQDTRGAHRAWAGVLAEDPLCATAWLEWARLLRDEAAWGPAAEAARRAIAADPLLAEGHLALGQALLRRAAGQLGPAAGSDLTVAVGSLSRAVELAGGATLVDALRERGLAHVARGGEQERAAGLADLRQAAERALVLVARDGVRSASVQRGLECLDLLARTEDELGQAAAAVETRERAQALRARARAEAARLLDEGRARRDRLDYSGAIERLDGAVELDPEWSEPIRERGACYLKVGNFVPGILDLSRAVELDPRLLDAVYNKVYQISYVVDLNRVIVELDKIVADHPDTSYVLFLRGQFRLAKTEFKRVERSDVEAGIADLERTLELNPAHLAARLYRGLLRTKLAELEPPGPARQALYDEALEDYDGVRAQAADLTVVPYLSAVAWAGRSRDTTLGAERADACRRLAVEALRAASQAGFPVRDRARNERALDPIRDHPEGAALLRPE